MALVGLSNIFFITLWFTIAAVRYSGGRWGYLLLVTILLWLASYINVIFGVASVDQWVIGIVLLFIVMAISGALSYIFRPASQ